MNTDSVKLFVFSGGIRFWTAPIVAISFLSMTALPAAAQYARAYANAPTDANILQANISSTHSDKYANDDQPTDLETRINNGSLIYTRTLPGFTGNAAGLGFIIPYTSILGFTADNEVTQDQDGLGDPAFTFDYNLYGAKAMNREEFARTLPTTYGGFHGVVFVPWGDYDSNTPKNIGANRYSLKLTYNQSFAFNEANTWLDLYVGGRVFGDNDEFSGDNTLSQDPLWGFESHLSHNLSPLVWVELGAIWGGGGATDINDVEQAGSQNNWKGVTGFGTRTWKGASILFIYSQTFARDSDDPDIQSVLFNVMQVF